MQLMKNNYMCGIIYAKRTDEKGAKKLILKRYEKQKTRGTDGFGFISLENGIVGKEFRAEEEKDIKKLLNDSSCDEILFHHRYPTSTPNFIEATHPIKVSHNSLKYDYYVVHNGVISNDDDLRKKHLEQGFIYNTEITKKYITSGNTYVEKMWNDSEALAIDIAQVIETDKKVEAKGSIAFIALQFDKETKKAVALFFGRNTNPLKIEMSEFIFCLSSESGTDIESHKLYKYDYTLNELSYTDKDIGDKYIPTKQTMGFKKNNIYDDYSDYSDYDEEWWESLKKDKDSIKKDDYYTKLQDLYDEISLLEDDIEFAKEYRGDKEEILQLEIELECKQQELLELYNIEDMYE